MTMKSLPLALAVLAALVSPARAEWGRTYISGGPAAPPAPVEPLAKEGATTPAAVPAPVSPASPAPGDVPLNAAGTWWFSPSVGFDVFTYDVKTHAYSVGIIPGVGYGLKYRPAGWTAMEAILAV